MPSGCSRQKASARDRARVLAEGARERSTCQQSRVGEHTHAQLAAVHGAEFMQNGVVGFATRLDYLVPDSSYLIRQQPRSARARPTELLPVAKPPVRPTFSMTALKRRAGSKPALLAAFRKRDCVRH